MFCWLPVPNLWVIMSIIGMISMMSNAHHNRIQHSKVKNNTTDNWLIEPMPVTGCVMIPAFFDMVTVQRSLLNLLFFVLYVLSQIVELDKYNKINLWMLCVDQARIISGRHQQFAKCRWSSKLISFRRKTGNLWKDATTWQVRFPDSSK